MGYYKFFQIFKFFFYGFTSRRNRKLLKILLVCIAIFIGIFWLSENVSFASTMNDDDVTQSIKYKYDSICLDFVRRFDSYDKNMKQEIISRFTELNNTTAPQYNYYIYYSTDDNGLQGNQVLNGAIYSNYQINVAFYNTRNFNSTFSSYTNWYNLTCNHILEITPSNNIQVYMLSTYIATDGDIYKTITNKLYLPSELLGYQSWVIYDYFSGNKTLAQIEQQLEQANATLTQIEEDLTDDSFDDTQDNPIEMEIFEDYNEDYQDNLFNNVLERFYNNIPNSTSSIYSINIPIPHSNGQYITLYSNAISKYINYFSQPMLYTFIQACWYVVFFKYFFWFGKKVLDWILTGELLEKGGGAFIKSLEKENAVVNAAMM